jgi:hypothetical protein
VKSFIARQLANEFVIIIDSLSEYDIFPVRFLLKERDFLKRQSFIFRPSSLDDVKRCLLAIWLIGRCTLVIEEVDMYCSAQKPLPALDRLLRYGRHRDISVIAISRRPADVPRLLTAQADEVVTFQQTEPRDLAWIRARSGQEQMQQVQNLHPFQYLIT